MVKDWMLFYPRLGHREERLPSLALLNIVMEALQYGTARKSNNMHTAWGQAEK